MPPVFESYSGVRERERRRDRRAEPREAPRVGPLSRCLKRNAPRPSCHGLGGVENQGQLCVPAVMSAKQLTSSDSWAAPPVPVLLEQSSGRKPGSDWPATGACGGRLVRLARSPFTPVLSCQQSPVLPANESHQKSWPLGCLPPSGASGNLSSTRWLFAVGRRGRPAREGQVGLLRLLDWPQ